MPDSIPRKQSWPSHRHPEVMWGQNAAEGLGNLKGLPSPDSSPGPHPRPEFGVTTPPLARLLTLSEPSSSEPVPSPRRSHSSAQAPLPSNPVPSRPSRSRRSPQPRPSRPRPPTASHPLPAHTSMGRGAWGTGPLPSQAAAAVVAAGCLSVSVSVPRGRQDLGMS